LFDRGLITIDEHYRTWVSKAVEAEHPAGVLQKFHLHDIVLPVDAGVYPSPKALNWHREQVFQG